MLLYKQYLHNKLKEKSLDDPPKYRDYLGGPWAYSLHPNQVVIRHVSNNEYLGMQQ